jgi:hypothetical protein
VRQTFAAAAIFCASCVPDFEPLEAPDAGMFADATPAPDATAEELPDAAPLPDPPAPVGWRSYASGTPIGRDRHSMAYSPLDRKLYLIGGVGGGSEHYDTWSWDGSAWTEETNAGSFRAAVDHAVSEEASGRLIMFGGQELNQSRPIQTMYRLEGGRWAQLAPNTLPSARSFHAMAHDYERGLTILYGGTVTDRSASSETWAWDGVDWSLVEIASGSSSQPPAMSSARMVYDHERRRVVMFGGKTTAGEYVNTLWAFEGDRWRQVSSVGSAPSVRSDAAVAYDVARRALIVFGGSNGGPPLGDTFELIDSKWRAVDHGERPHPVWNTRAAYDRAGARVILFGGSWTDSEGWQHGNTTFLLDPM